jgi:ribosomal-protein-alanine N-acetyltransferase
MTTMLIETPRLRLAPWGPRAVDDLVEMHSNAEVQRYLDAEARPWTRQKAENRLADWIRENAVLGLGKFPVRRKSDDAFVGRAGFSLWEDEPEIGYTFARPYWGQGYASEIAAGLRDWFFAARPERRFIGFAHVDNLGSRKVLERIGMRPTHQRLVIGMPHQFYALERTA